MRSNWHRALLVSFVLIMSSLAGCIGTDDDELEEGQYGTVMVSTYHVGEIVKAIAGDTVNVQMMSQNNIPVHDYSPALEDIVRLGDADLFLYHGLGLEPWADSTLEGLGSDAPAYAMVHTMPTGEISLDYETMLVDKLCDSLSEGGPTHILAEHAEDAGELHGDDGAHNLVALVEDDHDEHEHDEDREDHDDHDEHDEDREDHDDHDEHDHGDHEMLMPEDRLQASSDCPTGTVISVYHFEAGEYMLEFKGEHVESFMMAIAAMGGAHHHHDHGDHDDHGDDDHDNHGDDDHDNHDEDEMVCYDISTHTIDSSITTEEDCDAAGLMWVAANSGPGGDGNHDDDHDEEMNMTAMAEMMFAMLDANEDGSLDESEVHTMFEDMEGGHEEGVAFIGLHIEEEGEYGIALPAGVELHVLMAGGHEGHDHGSHDDHDDHDEDREDHDEDREDHDGHGDEGERDDHDDHDDHAEEELAYDPHSWLDPVAMAAQADVVLAKLIEVFPDGEDVFTENANAFKAELVTLDEKFKTLTSTCSDRTVAANHNAYSYLAYRYDIEFVTVHGLDPEGEPSAEDVVKVVEHIQEEGITVLFVEEYTDKSSIQSIVDETGVSIQILHTMEMAPLDSSDDYLSMMNKNFENLEAGMSCSASN